MGDYEVGGNRKGEKEVGRLCVRGVLQASVRERRATDSHEVKTFFGVKLKE